MDSTPIRTVRAQIAEHLRADILSGALPKGAPLREQSLADRFGVSRGPIRDVFLQLTQEGLLISEPNCGVRVSPAPSEWVQPLIVSIRREIEVFTLRQTIGRLAGGDPRMARLESIVEALGRACGREDIAEIARQDIAFHQCLLEAGGEEDLVAIWLPIVTRMILHYSRLKETQRIHEEHVAILDAVRDHDIDRAVAALEANIQ